MCDSFKIFKNELIKFIEEKEIETDACWAESFDDCCLVACKIASMGHKLPISIHNRMILGEQNYYTRIYAKSYFYGQKWIF